MPTQNIKVPEGMLEAAKSACRKNSVFGTVAIGVVLESALRWLSENPIVPTDEQATDLGVSVNGDSVLERYQLLVAEWQRRMFLEPEIEEIAELLKEFRRDGLAYNAIVESYRRGQKSKG